MTVPNAVSHIPATSLAAWYRMGPSMVPGAGDVYFNLTDSDGIRVVVGEPEGWEGVDFILPLDTVGGKDGALMGPQSIGPKVLQVRGVVVGPDPRTLRLWIARTRALLGPRAQVVWEQFDFGAQQRLAMVCRAEGGFRATPLMGYMEGGVGAPVQFNLVAGTPEKFAVGDGGQASTRCIGLPIAVVNGRTYDKTYDWDYGGVFDPGGIMNITNAGDVQAWPVFEITGPVDIPVITNDTTGESFRFADPIPAGVVVTVDSRTGVVTPNSYRLVGRPFALQPGLNTVRWRAQAGTYNEDAHLCLTWRSTWR